VVAQVTQQSSAVRGKSLPRKKLTFPRKSLTFAGRFRAEISLSADKTSPLQGVLRENTTFARNNLTFVTL
jgi:hypothetical protein